MKPVEKPKNTFALPGRTRYNNTQVVERRGQVLVDQPRCLFMESTQTLIAQAYSAFNHRDIDIALALMTENVSWPKASEGGRAIGKDEIRAYWTRQWQEFNPHVDPVEMLGREDGKTHVKVHQLVKSLGGDVLSDSEVWHIFTITNGLIDRMDLPQSETSSDQNSSAAFSRH